MKALNLRKFFLVAFGLLAVVLLGVTLIEVKGLPITGEFVGFVTALAILGLAALDNKRAKRLV